MPTMRSVPLGREPGDAEIASFADLIDRPLLIVGNGPSSAMPPYHRIPADVVVFRMNWFFLESNYHFGDRVDAYFSAIPNEKLEKLLQDEVRSGRYDVRRILSPMRHAANRDGDKYGLEPMTGVEELDSWSIPARHPRLARAFMSRPGLPTTGMQALAFGLGVGFREVYLAGVDLYESKDSRYGYTVTQAAESALKDKDLTPGYESAHGLDSDLAFLRSCLAEFPDAKIRSVSQSDTLHLFVPPADDELTDRPHLTPEAVPTLAVSKDTVDLELPEVGEDTSVIIPKVDGPLWKEIDGRKCAYVTVVSGSYHHGARALANSLREHSDVPLIALVTPDADRSALAASGIRTIQVPGIRNPMNSGGNKIQARFAMTYTKLHVFRLDFFDRLVYLDSDTVVKGSLDELFDGDDFAAVPDAGLDLPDGNVFNSGVFAVNPSHGMFEKMMSQLAHTTSYDGGDQGFLNQFFSDWRKLPLEYNTTKRIYSHHPQVFNEEDVKVLHYVGRKPWEPTSKGERYDQLDYAWLDYLSDWEKNELVRELRHTAAGGKPPEAGSSSPFRQAQQANRTNKANEAVRLLEAVIAEREPTSGELRELAKAYRRLGRHDDCARVLKQAYAIDPRRSVMKDMMLAQARSIKKKLA